MPLRGRGMENTRTVSGLPQFPAVQSASCTGLVVSWWDREICIWRIGAKAQHKNPRQKVARMLVKGEENISSVSISADGSLLAVATAAEVKVFHLRLRNSEGKSSLKIRKVDSPDALRKQGVRLLQFSPDGKWLVMIIQESEVVLARMIKNSEAKPNPSVLNTVVRLSRKKRSSGRIGFVHESEHQYIYTINRVAFSPDSTVLVVSDLSGFLESWAVEGCENPMAKPVEIPSKNSSDGSDEDNDSDDGEENAVIIYGQRWVRNPCGHELPRVDSAPVVLSFRPSQSYGNQRYHGNPEAHPPADSLDVDTQQSHKREEPLFVLTAKHQVYEFDVLLGKLTSWSRRNRTKYLPLEFRRIRDRAMGCIWDIQDGREGRKRERIWLYGSSWLGMLDLSQDFAPSAATDTRAAQKDLALDGVPEIFMMSKKRKRNLVGRDDQGHKERESGAGGRIPRSELRGIGKKVRKSIGPDMTTAETVWLDGMRNGHLSSDDDNDIGEALNGINTNGVQRLTNGHQPNMNGVAQDEKNTLIDGTDEDLDRTDTDEIAHFEDSDDNCKDKSLKKWHSVYKYRPILGVVPLSSFTRGPEASRLAGKSDNLGKSRQGKKAANGSASADERHNKQEEKGISKEKFDLPEVAIVERPLWDLDLPPRFVGIHDRK